MKYFKLTIARLVWVVVMGSVLAYPDIILARRVRDTELFLELRQTNTLGERISLVRQYRGFTQPELAAILGVKREIITQWENDYVEPCPLNTAELAQALNIDIWRLLTGFEKEEALEEENIIPKIPLRELAIWGENRIIGEIVKLAMIAKTIEELELASMLGVHGNYISFWLKGRKPIPSDKIDELASILDINAKSLMYLETEIPNEVMIEIEKLDSAKYPGYRVMEKREELGWSREYLAGLIGVSYSTIHDWEHGYIDINARHIPKLAKTLGMDVWKLLTNRTKNEALKRENLLPLIAPIELLKWGEQRIIGEIVKLARFAKGYAQEELEKILGIGQATFSLYERGLFPIPKDIIPILAKILELEPSQLRLESGE